MGGVDYGAGSPPDVNGMDSFTALSDSAGTRFTQPERITLNAEVASPRDWLWRVTWHRSTPFGILYQPFEDDEWRAHLVKGQTPTDYSLVSTLEVSGRPNEGTLRFREDGSAIMLLRRGTHHPAYLGFSAPPYASWHWRELSRWVGGPALTILEDGTMVFGGRINGPKNTVTAVGVLKPNGRIKALFRLPSGGDTGYPGLAVHDGKLWVSYYSSHEDRTSVYMATMPVDTFTALSTGRSRSGDGGPAAR